jgi:predicted nucleotidyltransferase
VPSTVSVLTSRGLAQPPAFVPDNIHYEVQAGSVAYGASQDQSDFDVSGFCIPPKAIIFPHLDGQIDGFGKQKQRFDVWQQHHINDPDALGGRGRSYDFAIFSIIKFFQLCMENNPNMLDTLFVPQDCVLHITKIGTMVREKRRDFLHKGAWFKFKGYAYSQLHKMSGKNLDPAGKRAQIREQFGYDVKFACHTIRLLHQIEQVLCEGDMDMRRHSEELKAIRRGEFTQKEIEDKAYGMEKYLETVYQESNLRYGPDEQLIKQLLLDCLEEHYGNLSACVVIKDEAENVISEVSGILEAYHRKKGMRG